MKKLELTQMENLQGGTWSWGNCIGGAAAGFEVGAWFGPWGAGIGMAVGCVVMGAGS